MRYRIILIILTLLNCSKKDIKNTTSADLKGKWVEAAMKTDTLSFESLENLEIMYLNRGVEMKDGYLLPKAGSGPYVYKLSQEKISILWMLSSNSSYNDYYFNRLENRIEIGNFYGSETNEILTFERLD